MPWMGTSPSHEKKASRSRRNSSPSSNARPDFPPFEATRASWWEHLAGEVDSLQLDRMFARRNIESWQNDYRRLVPMPSCEHSNDVASSSSGRPEVTSS